MTIVCPPALHHIPYYIAFDFNRTALEPSAANQQDLDGEAEMEIHKTSGLLFAPGVFMGAVQVMVRRMRKLEDLQTWFNAHEV